MYRPKCTGPHRPHSRPCCMYPRQAVRLLLSKDVQPVERRAGWLPYNPRSALVLSGAAGSPGIRAHRCWQLPVGEHTGRQCRMGRSWGQGGRRGLFSPCQPQVCQEALQHTIGFLHPLTLCFKKCSLHNPSSLKTQFPSWSPP